MTSPFQLRIGKRSLTKLWQCPDCCKQFRTPQRTVSPLRRACRCKGRVYVFGPAMDDLLSDVVFVRSESRGNPLLRDQLECPECGRTFLVQQGRQNCPRHKCSAGRIAITVGRLLHHIDVESSSIVGKADEE